MVIIIMKTFVCFLTITVIAIALEFDFIPDTRDPPSVRLYSQMVYASKTNNLIAFGGQFDTNTNFNDIWEYSLDSGVWKFILSSTESLPGNTYSEKRFSHGMFYVDRIDSVCVFGGMTPKGPLNDIWCFSIFSNSVIYK